jgi:hypothetical protein
MVEEGRRWCFGGGGGGGWRWVGWILDFREERGGGDGFRLYGWWEGNGEKEKKTDLKTVHAGLKPSTFECIGVHSTVLVQVHGCVCA